MKRSGNKLAVMEPDYLYHFHYDKDPEIGDKLEAVKDGSYDLVGEEKGLLGLLKDMRKGTAAVSKRIHSVGMRNWVCDSTSPIRTQSRFRTS